MGNYSRRQCGENPAFMLAFETHLIRFWYYNLTSENKGMNEGSKWNHMRDKKH